jgi:hypothetical protein
VLNFLHVYLVSEPVASKEDTFLALMHVMLGSVQVCIATSAKWEAYSQPHCPYPVVVNTHAKQSIVHAVQWISYGRVSSPNRGKTLIYSSKCADRLGSPLSLLLDGDWRSLSPGVKPSERDADDSPPHSAELNNERRHNFNSLQDFTAYSVLA